jgi:hypothetical protein
MQDLFRNFIEKLTERYGPQEVITSKFGIVSYGKVASDLSISASQFSKLLNGTATEGMYLRAIGNIDRLIQLEQVRKERDMALEELENHLKNKSTVTKHSNLTNVLVIAMVSIAAALAGIFCVYSLNKSSEKLSIDQVHPLSTFFDQDFQTASRSPYLDESEVQDFCPCSGYEGKWTLANTYKVPLPGIRKPGLYYLARVADVRMKCSRVGRGDFIQGQRLDGYEHLINEIWIDVQSTPLSPAYFDKNTMAFTEEFHELDFETNNQFKKVCTVESFFVDQFTITDESIIREGEPVGRFVRDVDQELINRFQIDLRHILNNVLGGLVKTNCQEIVNPFCDPNTLEEGQSIMSFDCMYTIRDENLGFGGAYPYIKSYQLEEQHYRDNLTCSCDQLTERS